MEKSKDNKLYNINKENENNSMDEFNFILNRSEKIIKMKNINNKVKEINYTFSSEENYSDEILNYLTQTIDKINQYKYNLSLNTVIVTVIPPCCVKNRPPPGGPNFTKNFVKNGPGGPIFTKNLFLEK